MYIYSYTHVIYKYIYICMYEHVCVYECGYIQMYMYTHMHTHTHMCIYMNIHGIVRTPALWRKVHLARTKAVQAARRLRIRPCVQEPSCSFKLMAHRRGSATKGSSKDEAPCPCCRAPFKGPRVNDELVQTLRLRSTVAAAMSYAATQVPVHSRSSKSPLSGGFGCRGASF